jgi:hypothetical protein
VGPRSESPSPEFRAPKLVQARALSPLGCFAGQGRSDAAVPPWFMVHARGMDRGGRGGGNWARLRATRLSPNDKADVSFARSRRPP